MSKGEQLLALDFGTGFIRVARTLLLEGQLGVTELIEFGGEPFLRNVVWLNPEHTAALEVGEEVFIGGLAYEHAKDVIQWVPLDADPKTEMGRAAEILCDTVRTAAGADQQPGNGLEQTQLLVQTDGTARTAQVMLAAAINLPAPQIYNTALAAIAFHDAQISASGICLVLDLGASATRSTLCRMQAPRNLVQVITAAVGRPGGRDFDRAIADLIAVRLPNLNLNEGVVSLKLMRFAEQWKEGLSQSWVAGDVGYEARTPFGTAETFAMSVEEFQKQETIAALIAEFSDTSLRALRQVNITESEIDNVILVGGGALFPFVVEQIRVMFPRAQLLMADAPMETVVRGLARLAMPAPVPPANTILPRPPDQVSAPVHKQRAVHPTLSFGLELLGWGGFLGFGWIFGLGKIANGCAVMLLWWVALATSVFVTGVFAVWLQAWWVALLWVPIWLSGPILSGWLAHQQSLALQRQAAQLSQASQPK